jgi:energy-coupling factor transport system ATP-binding protein
MIRVSNLSFSYSRGLPALRAVDLEIRPGERLAIIGANGSGKTTLARCLNGLHLPEEGEVRVDQLSTRNPEALFEIRRRVGMVFQNPDDQLVSTAVETEIAFGLENLAIPHTEMRERVDAALRAFHLEPYRHHPPHRLSGGEKQRVAIAAAVALRPGYLVLDEPTALLDPQSRSEVGALLRDLRDQFGISTIHITQLPEEAARTERILVMHGGSLLYDAPPDELLADPALLQDLGLDLPFTCSLGHRLRRMGFPLPESLPIHPDADVLAAAVLPGCSPSPLPPRIPSSRSVNPSIKLKTRNLAHVYDQGLPTEHAGIDAVDIDIPAGGIVALIGPSGSGKTTLAQHLNGLLKPYRGSVLLDARDIWDQDLTQVRRRVGLVFQFPELQLFEETVEQDVAFGPRNLGCEPGAVEELVTRALDEVGLPRAQFGQRSPLYLSGGEKRRIALAGILAMDPEVLVMDEPTAGLDPRASATMCDLFLRLQSQGKTLVLITHDMDIVAQLATHIVVLQNGRVTLQGEVRTILSRPNFADLSGLTPPAPVRFMQALAARGASVPTNLLTIAEVEAIFQAMKK